MTVQIEHFFVFSLLLLFFSFMKCLSGSFPHILIAYAEHFSCFVICFCNFAKLSFKVQKIKFYFIRLLEDCNIKSEKESTTRLRMKK